MVAYGRCLVKNAAPVVRPIGVWSRTQLRWFVQLANVSASGVRRSGPNDHRVPYPSSATGTAMRTREGRPLHGVDVALGNSGLQDVSSDLMFSESATLSA